MSLVVEKTGASWARSGFGGALAVLVAIFALAWFAHLEHRGLFIPDEGRYAEIPREMLASGDWITPRLNNLKYFEKPPLQYWLTAASFLAFGEDEWTARLAPALLGFAALAAVGLTGARLWGRRAGMLSAAILGSNWIFYLGGQYLTLDMSVSAFLTFGMCAFLLAQRAQARSPEQQRWMMATWIAMALAVLSKGMIGVVLPALALLAHTATTRDLRLWQRLSFARGLPLFLAITAPWFVLVQQRNPEFLEFFFIREHFQRFAMDAHQRPGAWWYYLPILLFGLLPWTPALLHSALHVRSWKMPAVAAASFRPEKFCTAWAVSVIVFFSFSHSKLPAYVLPAIPAIALILGYQLRQLSVAPFKWAAAGTAGLGALFFIGVTQIPRVQKFSALGVEGMAGRPWLYCAAAALLIGGLLGVRLCNQRKPGHAIMVLAISSFACWSAAFAFLHQADAHFSSERLIEGFARGQKPFAPDAPFYSVSQFDHSVPFYLGRTLTLVDVRGELGPGIDAEPDKVISSMQAFRTTWARLDGQAYAIMPPKQYEDFLRENFPMFEVLRDTRLVIVSRYR